MDRIHHHSTSTGTWWIVYTITQPVPVRGESFTRSLNQYRYMWNCIHDHSTSTGTCGIVYTITQPVPVCGGSYTRSLSQYRYVGNRLLRITYMLEPSHVYGHSHITELSQGERTIFDRFVDLNVRGAKRRVYSDLRIYCT